MSDELWNTAKKHFVALFELLEKFKQEHPNLAILGLHEAYELVSSTEPDPGIRGMSFSSLRVKSPGGRGHCYTLKVSIPGYSFRLRAVPADPAICLLNTVLMTGSGGGELLAAERRAQEKLRGHISEEQWTSYQLTSAFTEQSKRSNLLYLFRRGFPTLAFKSSPEGNNFFMGLCLHAEGYEPFSWAGRLCSTDDVITALLLMRSQEKKFWAKAGHHELHSPMLGI